ncbi:MAG: SPOR domain-containing protein, partial [Pseudomonadota bacterium]
DPAPLFTVDEAVPETTELADGQVPEAEEPAADAPQPVAGGLVRSLRPSARPARPQRASSRTALAAVDKAAVNLAVVAAVGGDTDVAPGTRLVQLGAFDTADEAIRVWDSLRGGQLRPVMTDKDRIIQEAESGGQVFYRLRAGGFSDLADARRFCAVLLSENAECIPVLAR